MSVAFDRLPPGAMLIGQDWISDSSGGVFEHIYPATGKVNATITMAGPEEIDRAVVTAWAAQQIWMKITVDKRRDILLRLADLVERGGTSLALSSSLALVGFRVTLVPAGSLNGVQCAGSGDGIRAP